MLKKILNISTKLKQKRYFTIQPQEIIEDDFDILEE
jgi:hypothetical protein